MINSIKELLKKSSFMDLRKGLEKIEGIESVDFAFNPSPYYSFLYNNKKWLVINEKYVEDPDYTAN